MSRPVYYTERVTLRRRLVGGGRARATALRRRRTAIVAVVRVVLRRIQSAMLFGHGHRLRYILLVLRVFGGE